MLGVIYFFFFFDNWFNEWDNFLLALNSDVLMMFEWYLVTYSIMKIDVRTLIATLLCSSLAIVDLWLTVYLCCPKFWHFGPSILVFFVVSNTCTLLANVKNNVLKHFGALSRYDFDCCCFVTPSKHKLCELWEPECFRCRVFILNFVDAK